MRVHDANCNRCFSNIANQDMIVEVSANNIIMLHYPNPDKPKLKAEHGRRRVYRNLIRYFSVIHSATKGCHMVLR